MFREIMAIRTSQMMTSRSLICLLENQNGGKLQKFFVCNSLVKYLFFTRRIYALASLERQIFLLVKKVLLYSLRFSFNMINFRLFLL
jgi:hypothetical protein